MFPAFPWTNFHELNLDWMLSRVKTISELQSMLEAEIRALSDGTFTVDLEYVADTKSLNLVLSFNRSEVR